MKFKFLGTPECPDEIMMRDIVFEKGKSVEVEDDLALKLSRLEYFAEVKAGRPKNAKDSE
jgi:hypothetical protein